MGLTTRFFDSQFYTFRYLSSFAPLCLMVVMAIPVSVANAQLVSSSRDPDVSGSVIDNIPFSSNTDGDSVSSRRLIGNINGSIQKVVLEFDISDIVPGVMESARITGEIGPNNGLPEGERSHRLTVSSGDGVLSTADYPGGGFNIRTIRHQAGDRSSYDFEITSAFRSIVLDNTGYLRKRISPSSTVEQGWDAASFPKLELSLRPTPGDTVVYYQPPTAGAEALGESSGYFIDEYATEMDVSSRNYSPFAQRRGLLEYDLSSIPASSEVLWAVLDVSISGRQSQNGSGLVMDIVGYRGDGTVTESDVMPSSEWVGSTGAIQNVGTNSWAIDPDFVETILRGRDHLGLLFQPGDNSGLEASIQLVDPFGESRRPHLAIAYTPGALLGDVDTNGVINFSDIQPFIASLQAGTYQAEADCNGDGFLTFSDIAPFVAILQSQ